MDATPFFNPNWLAYVKRTRFFLKKLAWALFTIIFVIVLNFFLFRVLPGDPAKQGVRDPRMTKESIEAIRVRFGLDKPIINCFKSLNPIEVGDCLVNPFDTQFFIYARNLVQGDLGVSFHYNRPVKEVLLQRLWNTVLLIGAGQILAIVLGVVIGIMAAWKAKTKVDYSALLISLLAWSLPTFWLGMMLLFWGSNNGFPIGGKATPGMRAAPLPEQIADILHHMVLPTLTYTIIFMGEYMLIMRSSLLDVLSEDYILTAKAKGLSTFQILKDHALKNAMLPLVTVIALNLGFTMAGAIQIETVFSWPGLGGAIYEGVVRRDYPMLQGAFMMIAISVIVANLLAELGYSILDPRVKTD